MKILFHHRIASRDGQSVHMDEMIGALRELGHEVVVVGPAQTAAIEFGGEAGRVAWLKRHLPRGVYELLELAYTLVAYRRLRRACREHRPDAVYERYNLYMLAGVWLRRAYRVPLLMEVNAPLFAERAEHDGLALRRLAAWTERTAWRGADVVLPVTAVLARHVRAAGVPAERIAVIPNGINRARFAAAPAPEAAKHRLGLDGRTVLGFTGFVRAWHRLDQVIDLLAEAGPEAGPLHLLVVGDGPDRAALEAHARARGVADRFTVTGIVGRDTVAGYIAAFDIALQPGVTPYASPLKLFEYMALGCAIVAPDAENIREILTDGVDAVLFDPDRPGSAAAAILRVCSDPALRSRLGAATRATIAEKRLTWTHNAERVVALCRQLGAAPAPLPAATRPVP